MADPREGWRVDAPRAARVAVLIPVLLLVFLSLASWLYFARLRPNRQRPFATFPAPGIETYVHPGVTDPVITVPRPVADARLRTATQEVVREGLPGWPAARAR